MWERVTDAKAGDCRAAGCPSSATKGGHIWLVHAGSPIKSGRCYIVPVCDTHNTKKYDAGLTLKARTKVLSIRSHECYNYD